MNVIIPAAGEGVRLRPHTHTIPKPLLKVAGKPILGHILDSVLLLNPEKICIVVGHYGTKIIDFIDKTYKKELEKFRFIHQEKRAGLGHAVFLSFNEIDMNEDLLILLGDTIFDVDYSEIVNSKRNIIAVSETDEPQRFGIVQVEGERIFNMVEKPKKPPSNLAIVGIYYFLNGKKLFSSLEKIIKEGRKTRDEYQLTDGMKLLLNEEEIYISRIKGWYDCGKVETLLRTNKFLLKKNNYTKEYPNTVIIPPVYIPDDVKINNSLIGPYVSVGFNSEITNSIVRNTIIYDGGVVKNVLLENSIIGVNARIVEDFKVVNIGDSSVIEPVQLNKKEEEL